MPASPPRTQRPRRTAFFDQWSNTYDDSRLQAFTYRPIHEAMIRSLRSSDSDDPLHDVLDLGCGTGQFLVSLASEFPHTTIHGIDLSAGMLREASTRAPDEVGLVRGDAQLLPFADDSFDAVTCSESFHWYPDQEGALHQVSRVLRPGGRLLIASIAASTAAGDRALRRWSSVAGQPLRALPPRRLRNMLERTGFEVTRQRRLPRLGLIPWPVLTEGRLPVLPPEPPS